MENKNKNAFEQIIECIDKKKSFLLEAGAGSGKTYTLIQTIQYILDKDSNKLIEKGQKIACITYTNIAKDELIERLDYNELVEINTIHEFLWSIIKDYQLNLKKELLKYHDTFEDSKKIENLEEILKNKKIKYGEYGRRLDKGEITHNDVIYLFIELFNNYPRLKSILSSRYPYFFIDEYQDTFENIVNIFFKILDGNKDKFLLGFFGDFMQKIYQDERIGKIENTNLKKIQKIENYRSGKKIVDLVNKVRNIGDNLEQKAQRTNEGKVEFYYSDIDISAKEKYKKVKEKLGWDFVGKPKNNKILVLTNKKIANDLGFNKLLDIFSKRYGMYGNDRLKQKDNAYIDFILNKIEQIIFFYKNNKYYDFFKLFGKEDFKINTLEDRKKLKTLILELEEIRKEKTIGEVLDYIFDNKILIKTEGIEKFEEYLCEDFKEDIEKKDKQEKNKKLKEDLMNLKYEEIIKYNEYIEDKTPYSTQHGTKGAEYDNVLLVIDDSHRWYIYRGFDKLIAGKKLNKDDEKALKAEERLLNLLYVSVSRAKEELAILYLSDLDIDSLNGWKNIFGEKNIIKF